MNLKSLIMLANLLLFIVCIAVAAKSPTYGGTMWFLFLAAINAVTFNMQRRHDPTDKRINRER